MPSHSGLIALAALASAAAPAARAAEAPGGAATTGALAPAVPVAIAAAAPNCTAGECRYQLTADQFLAVAQRLVAEKKFQEARPLIAALGNAPGMEVPYNFLDGLVALESGDAKTAAARFRTILASHPHETRVRLELARALLVQGDFNAADYHLRLAAQDKDLPEDIARTVRQARSIIRSKRNWTFGFDVGLAPDTNINSATNAETVDVNFGPTRVPLTLDQAARARSGTGITASVYGSLRLPVAERMSIVTDIDGSMVNYRGEDADDYTFQLAAGPELRFGRATSVTLQGVGLYRRYAGQVAARQFGAKLTVQHDLGRSQRIGLQLDGRHATSDFGAAYTGWQTGAAATFEQVVNQSALASVSVFLRRDMMGVDAYSSTTMGVSLGFGGELPLGINAGVSGGISRSRYDEAEPFFSADRRQDWRYQARVYAGLRKLRWWGFSPSIEYRYSRVDTNYRLYQSNRHRFEFKLARYF